MNPVFKEHVETLEPSYLRLLGVQLAPMAKLPPQVPVSGIYVLYEGSHPVYVGRSNRMRGRLQEHSRPGSNHNTAPFAFRLAREKTGNLRPTYSSEKSRAALERDPEFKKAFLEAKERVKRMQVRFISEDNPIRQYLLEVYTALSTGAKYNDFDTH